MTYLHLGITMGTTIMGTIKQSPSNESTWPLTNTNLAFSMVDSQSGLDEAYQFILFDQVFPIEFTLLNVQAISQSHDNVAFTVTISWYNNIVIWSQLIENTRIIKNDLNKVDFYVTLASKIKFRFSSLKKGCLALMFMF
jgi:hypothetical protein